ncbi:MAG: site-specific integrase [Pseudomonadota bacterium]
MRAIFFKNHSRRVYDRLPTTYKHQPSSSSLSDPGRHSSHPRGRVWLAKQKSLRTRRAYRQDVLHFMQTVGARSREELRTIDHKAVVAWERYMREVEGVQASTIRPRLAAL